MAEDVRPQEQLDKVNAELNFMHNENENIKLEFQEEKNSLVAKFNKQMNEKDKELHSAHQKLALMKEEYGKNLEHMQGKINALQLQSNTHSNDLNKSIEIAHETLKDLVKDKDEIIQSQKDVIESLRNATYEGNENVCRCVKKDVHECEWNELQIQIQLTCEENKTLVTDRDELVNAVKIKNQEFGEYSTKIEEMKKDADAAWKAVAEKTSEISKLEEDAKSKDEFLDTRRETIKNLIAENAKLKDEASSKSNTQTLNMIL